MLTQKQKEEILSRYLAFTSGVEQKKITISAVVEDSIGIEVEYYLSGIDEGFRTIVSWWALALIKF